MGWVLKDEMANQIEVDLERLAERLKETPINYWTFKETSKGDGRTVSIPYVKYSYQFPDAATKIDLLEQRNPHSIISGRLIEIEIYSAIYTTDMDGNWMVTSGNKEKIYSHSLDARYCGAPGMPNFTDENKKLFETYQKYRDLID